MKGSTIKYSSYTWPGLLSQSFPVDSPLIGFPSALLSWLIETVISSVWSFDARKLPRSCSINWRECIQLLTKFMLNRRAWVFETKDLFVADSLWYSLKSTIFDEKVASGEASAAAGYLPSYYNLLSYLPSIDHGVKLQPLRSAWIKQCLSHSPRGAGTLLFAKPPIGSWANGLESCRPIPTMTYYTICIVRGPCKANFGSQAPSESKDGFWPIYPAIPISFVGWRSQAYENLSRQHIVYFYFRNLVENTHKFLSYYISCPQWADHFSGTTKPKPRARNKNLLNR